MAKAKFGVSRKDTAFGRDLIAAAREALAHKKGKIALPTKSAQSGYTLATPSEPKRTIATSNGKAVQAVVPSHSSQKDYLWRIEMKLAGRAPKRALKI